MHQFIQICLLKNVVRYDLKLVTLQISLRNASITAFYIEFPLELRSATTLNWQSRQ